MTSDQMIAHILCDEQVDHCRFLAHESGRVEACDITYKDGSVGTLVFRSPGEWRWHHPSCLSTNGGSALTGREC